MDNNEPSYPPFPPFMRRHGHRRGRRWGRAPIVGGPWRLRQLRQFDFGFQHYEEEGTILRVVVPLPGIDKQSLDVKAKERFVSVTAKVTDGLRKYATRPDDTWEIELETEIIPKSAKARYVDGVLLVDLQVKDPGLKVEDIDME